MRWKLIIIHLDPFDNSYMNIFIRLVIIFSLLTGCIANNIDITLKNPRKTNPINASVTNVSVVNNKLIITGTNFSNVTGVKLSNNSLTEVLSVESVSGNQIIANSARAIAIASGAVFDLILSNASAAASFPVSFTVANGSITAAMLNSMGA